MMQSKPKRVSRVVFDFFFNCSSFVSIVSIENVEEACFNACYVAEYED